MDQPPQSNKQSMDMERAESPQVITQMQVNNNTQYMAAGPSRTRTIMPYQLPPNPQMSIVAQDALGLGTTASENNSYTPSIETAVAHFEYKKLPFYEVIDDVIKPTLLTGTDICTLPNVPEGMKEATFKFVLSVKQVNFVSLNRKFSHGKYEYLYQFQIRICQLVEPVPIESPDYMPLELFIRVNRKECQLPPTPLTSTAQQEHTLTQRSISRRTARPIDCTGEVKLSPIVVNNITINWKPDGKKYIFAMYIVNKIDGRDFN